MNIDESREGVLAYGSINTEDSRDEISSRRWPKPSKNFTILLSVFTVCVMITLIALSILTLNKSRKNIDEGNVCLTPQCVHEASKIMKYMDTSIDPCDDFYHFSCGNYIKKNIPDNQLIVSVLDDIDNKYRLQLKEIVENDLFPKSSSHRSVLHTYYQNCMNRTGIEKHGLETISKIIESVGGWPVVKGDSWQGEQFHWIDAISSFTRKGFSTDYFFSFKSAFNFTNVTEFMYHIDQPKLGLSSQFFLKGFGDNFVSAYYKYMIDIAVIFGANRTRAKIELKKVMDFQFLLADCMVPPEEQRNVSRYNNQMTLEELEQKYGVIAWNEYYKKVLDKKNPLDQNYTVIVMVPSYFEKLNELLRSTDNRTLANYIFWRSIESVVAYLPDEVRKAEYDYRMIREGISERTHRWVECIDNTVKTMESVTVSLFYRTFFNTSVKASADSLAQRVYDEFVDMIQKNDWMDRITKTKALEKILYMRLVIGNSTKIQSPEQLDKKYKNITLKPDGDYLQSHLALSKYLEPKSPEYVKDEVIDGPAVLNPNYNFLFNEIEIPAGILQDPFMNQDAPNYINFATVGFMIGHEISHGYDDFGHQFDMHGNLNDWWDQTTKEQFLSKTKCLVYQYGNFSSKEVDEQINGKVSLGENMADNGAVKVTHMAYENWIKENGPEKQLPGLDYTPFQLFWINTAQLWCAKYRPQLMRELIVTDHHCPEEFRIKGTVSNSLEFARDFQCPVDSKMNPKEKCSVW